VINIYPNPFNQRVVLTGLNESKIYEIRIVSVDGMQLLQQQVRNTGQHSLQLTNYKAGTYLLTLYDKRKQRVIGSVQIVKQ
jgi:hypothetical protein